ncbi:hypothetical protein MNBD_GAMMA12-3388 [hydrothermal vent metagenome]|uniref:Type IV pilus biogenesis protein PilO n=1 Tax=hydrothermal vent metagenome TaxID=652676 RepID=A0A3B0Y292_9ZZZZ
MNLDQLKELEFDKIGNWPWIMKLAVITLSCAVVIGLVVYLDTLPQLENRETLEKKEKNELGKLQVRAAKASRLPELKKQLAYMQRAYKKMRERLPTKKQVAALLIDISQKGRAAGLEFRLYDPQSEQKQKEFVQIPIAIRVIGTYNELGKFVSDIAELPRIVTLHNIRISKSGSKGKLQMSVLARTYKYEDKRRKKYKRRRR